MLWAGPYWVWAFGPYSFIPLAPIRFDVLGQFEALAGS